MLAFGLLGFTPNLVHLLRQAGLNVKLNLELLVCIYIHGLLFCILNGLELAV